MANNLLEQPKDVAGGVEQLSSDSDSFKLVSARRYLRKSQERRVTGFKHIEPLKARQLSDSSSDSDDSDTDGSNSSDSDNEGGGSGTTKTKAPSPALTFPPHLFEATLTPTATPTITGEQLSSTAQSSNLTAATVGGSFAAGFFLIFLAVGILFIRRRKNQTPQAVGGLTGASAIQVGGGAVGARVKTLSDHSDITLYDEKWS